MDILHSFLNLVAPPFTFVSLFLLLPPYQALKSFLSIVSALFSENVAYKVILITGASSGIGEVTNLNLFIDNLPCVNRGGVREIFQY